ncbi:MAG: mechanosensitive ion channel family protein, partial [Pseudomonadota bacterium]|nr:mechanosensitive ion channel family protein [Pseudomonadota bacterium]
IGFALKDVAENFVAGILLLIQQPFDIGDAIEVAGYAGTVTDIKVRDTTLRSWEGLLVIIPNAKVYTQVITNYSRLEKRRLSLEITVDYETDLSTAQNTILEVVTQLPGIITDTPAPTLVFNEFADNGIKATLYYWYDAQKTSYWTALDDAVKGIKTALEQADIHIPRGTYILQSPSPPPDHSTDSLDESP